MSRSCNLGLVSNSAIDFAEVTLSCSIMLASLRCLHLGNWNNKSFLQWIQQDLIKADEALRKEQALL